MKDLLTTDINARYADALHYPEVDRFMTRCSSGTGSRSSS